MQRVGAQAGTYWRYPYRPVMSSRQLVEFVVLDAEPVSASQSASRNSRFLLADVQVCFRTPKLSAVSGGPQELSC